MLNQTRFSPFDSRLMILPLCLAIMGCGQDGPETHAVAGRIELQGGNIANLAGSTLELALSTDPKVRAFAEIQPDGRFQLQSLQSGELRQEVLEGKYRARIIPNDEDPANRRQAFLAIAPRYLKFETSGLAVQIPPAEGDLILSVSLR